MLKYYYYEIGGEGGRDELNRWGRKGGTEPLGAGMGTGTDLGMHWACFNTIFMR